MLFLLIPLLTPDAAACDFYIYDDYGDGSADGRVQGGTFVNGGWRPDGGSIVYDLPNFASGTITMRLSNVDERGVSQHDLLELFSGTEGSFSDGRRDNFIQVKFAGDIYDGYDGRVKLQAGPEHYGDVEAGAWTSEFDWNPDGAYDFSVSWGGMSANMGIGGVLSTSADYSYYGYLTMATLRIPNDGSYARDALMDDIVIAGVSLCTDDPGRTTPITPDSPQYDDAEDSAPRDTGDEVEPDPTPTGDSGQTDNDDEGGGDGTSDKPPREEDDGLTHGSRPGEAEVISGGAVCGLGAGAGWFAVWIAYAAAFSRATRGTRGKAF
jgi:hypothetical protein